MRSLDGKNYLEHRLVWAWHYGEVPRYRVIDHINNIRTDNRIENLQPLTFKQNVRKKKMSCRNTSGHTGVCWNKNTNAWLAQIHVGGKHINLGNFADVNQAVAARQRAERTYGYTNVAAIANS